MTEVDAITGCALSLGGPFKYVLTAATPAALKAPVDEAPCGRLNS